MHKLFPVFLRWVVGILLVCGGIVATFTGVAYDGMLRGDGIPARLVGIALTVVGALILMKKFDLTQNNNEPPDF